MTLKELKDYIESFNDGKVFEFGISEPFSWRGIYAEVAFDLVMSSMTKQEMMSHIQMAYDNTFYGYKGGDYRYGDYTEIHFERDYSAYTDGGHVGKLIAAIEKSEAYQSQEERLVKTAFK